MYDIRVFWIPLWLPGTIQHHSGYDISLPGTIQHLSGYYVILPSTKQQHTSYDLYRYRVRYISIGVRYNSILVTIWGYRVRHNSVTVTIQHHRVPHNGIPGTLRQYTGKFDTIHLMVRYNNTFVQYSPQYSTDLKFMRTNKVLYWIYQVQESLQSFTKTSSLLIHKERGKRLQWSLNWFSIALLSARLMYFIRF